MTVTLTRPEVAAAAPAAAPPPARLQAAGDVVAVAALAWLLWTLARTDGGVDLDVLHRATWPLLAAVPVAAPELRRMSRLAPWLAAWYGTAALAALAFAGVRSGAVVPAIVYAVLPVAALLTVRVWRRPWGPAAVGGMLLLVFATAWWDGFLAWAGTLPGPTPVAVWRALSWHNQSAILMGGGGLLAAGVAVTVPRPRAAVLAVVAAGAGFGAAWLTGSRGGLVALALGAAVLAAHTRFRRPRRWAAVGAASVAAVLLLVAFSPAGGGQALGNKSLSAGDSAAARTDHMAAAVAMFVDRPLFGHGLGSYAVQSAPHAAGGSNPSYHAHNELAEPFAEGGLAFGGAMAAVLAAIGLAGLRLLRRGVGDGRPPRPGLVAGSLAALAALVAHAAIDFDWLFPILGVLAAVAGGIVLAASAGARPPGSRWAALGLAPVAALLALGVVGASVELDGAPAPWNAKADVAELRELLAADDAEAARAVARDARRWNPGHSLLGTLEAAAAHESGAGTVEGLLDTLDSERPTLVAFNEAAASLIRTGDLAAADEVLAAVADLFRERPGWDLSASIDRTWGLSVIVAGIDHGCAGAEATAAVLAADPLTDRIARPTFWDTAARFCD